MLLIVEGPTNDSTLHGNHAMQFCRILNMSWKWIVGREQISNALRFATKAECEEYGNNLGMRWFGMPSPARADESSDPVTEGNAFSFKPAGHRVSLWKT